jgi:DNA mismatch repair ATPase MutS
MYPISGSPSTSLKEINARQSLVTFFYTRLHLRDVLRKELRKTGDTKRIVQRFLLGRGDLNDLVSINRTISALASIQRSMEKEKVAEGGTDDVVRDEWSSIDTLMSRAIDLRQLHDKIAAVFSLPGKSDPLDRDELWIKPEYCPPYSSCSI